MNEIVPGTEINIVSSKLQQTYSPFQKVTVLMKIYVAETGAHLVQVRDIRGQGMWFGLEELKEAKYLADRHIAIATGKRARLLGIEPKEDWDELTLAGYAMQGERETLASADRYMILPFALNSVLTKVQ